MPIGASKVGGVRWAVSLKLSQLGTVGHLCFAPALRLERINIRVDG